MKIIQKMLKKIGKNCKQIKKKIDIYKIKKF